ncbi:sterol desaturase family protein [Leptothermofonsia sp. ETS-13]|uniref:sterol desaturase family protein n=1 Tax=Leptothermofonsia sp. ETS-13 TaxID=3035696 RepID=UPI003BA0668F
MLNAITGQFLAITQFILPIYAGFFVIEKIFPAQRKQPVRDLVFNLLWFFLFWFLTILLIFPLNQLVGVAKAVVPIPRMSFTFGTDLPSQIANGIVYFLIFDFFYYWFHRFQHTTPALWSIHKLHHSDVSLNVTTSSRHHWLEEPARVFLIAIPMGLIFDIQPVAVGIVATVFNAWAFFIHANWKLQLGILTPVVVGPQLHRIHHSIHPEHADKNFAAYFPIWDILFGSYCPPKPGEFPETGLHSGEKITNLWKASFSPFTEWWNSFISH